MSHTRELSPEKQAYRWLMGQTKSAKQWLKASILLGVGNGILLLIQAYFLSDIIHDLIMEATPRDHLIKPFILCIIVIVLRAVCAMGREQCGFRAGVQVRTEIRKILLDKLQRLGPLVINQNASGSWTTVVVEQVEDIQEFIARYLPQMVLAVLLPLVMLIVIFPMNWVVGVIFLTTAPLIPVFMAMVGLKAAAANRKNFKALERLGGFFLDRLQGIETLRLFRRGQVAQDELSAASENFRDKTMDVLRLAFLSSTVLEFFAAVSIALTAVYLGMSFLGYLDFGFYGHKVELFTALFLLLLAPEFYQPLRELGTYYHAKAKAVGAAESIIEIMEQPEPEEQGGRCSFQGVGAIGIEARQLTVKALKTEIPLLKQLDFSIKAGSRVAVVGPSGAGKTTLINTLMGFYPFQGALSVEGQLLSDLSLAHWREHMAWLGQLPLIIEGSVVDNIAFGRDMSREQVLDALKRANGLDILDGLPNQLDSILQEQGGNLSVGQAQRIALARAIALPVGLLILDEPTASLDLDSEKKVLAALDALMGDTTVITVTHRVSQIMSMDQVLMIDNGQRIAAGHPKVLMSQSTAFRRFIEGQGRSIDNE